MVLFLTLNAAAQTREDAAKFYNDGVSAYNAKNFAVAITAFNKAIETADKVGEEANEVKDGAIKLIPSCHLQNALALYNGKKLAESIDEFNEAIEVGGKYNDQNVVNAAKKAVPQLYRIMGNQQFSTANYEKARTYYRMGLKITPEETQNLLGIGLSFAKQNNADSALVYFDRVIELGTKNNKAADVSNAKAQARDIFIEKASAAEKAKKYEDAIAEYNNVLKYDADNNAIYYQIAFCNYFLSKWDEAIESSNKALSLITKADDKGKVYLLLGNVYLKKNDNANACANYKLASASPRVKAQALSAIKGLKCK